MLNQSQLDYLYILRKAVRQEPLDLERISEMDVHRVFQYAIGQTHAALFLMCFQNNGCSLPTELKERCQSDWDHGIRREALMNVERGHVYEFFNQEGIWHCSLKGIVLSPLYPALGTRYSSDNDILIDKNGRKKLKHFMKERGYTVQRYGGSHHDSYLKKPSYHFEFHHRMLSHENQGEVMDYFNRVQERLAPDKEGAYGYHLTNEDFYLHMIVHMYFHYGTSGAGFRGLIDTYYYRKAYTFSEEYVQKKLERFGVAEFEKAVCELTEKLFGDRDARNQPQFSEAEEKMMEYMFSSGVNGNSKVFAENLMEECKKKSRTDFGARVRYLSARLFPSMDYYKTDRPFLYRFKIFIPFFVAYRALRAVIGRKELQDEFGVLKNGD